MMGLTRASLAVALVLAAAGAAAGQPAPARIAVLDLAPDPTIGLVAPKPEEARALTEQLREELARTGRFTVVEPARVAEALRESGVTAAECASAECATRLGARLGADKVVTGRVVRMMTLMWGVDLYTTEVGTGKRTSGAGEFKGDYLVLKTLGMRQLARQLAEY